MMNNKMVNLVAKNPDGSITAVMVNGDDHDKVCKFIINNYLDIHNELLKDLIKCDDKDFKDVEVITNKLYYWLTNNVNKNTNDYNVDNFIKKLDKRIREEFI